MPMVGERYLTLAYDMLFVHGWFHGDLHPGNVLVLPDGRLGLLDFGMVGRLTREMRTHLLTLFVAIDRGDHRTVARLFYEIAVKDKRVDYGAVERETLEILERNLQVDDMNEIRIGPLISDLTRAAARQGARVPLAYTMFFKALLTSEGLARTLLYEQNPIAAAKPYFQRMLAETFSEDTLRQEVLYQGISLSSLGKRVPITLAQLVEDIDTQRLLLNVRDEEGRRAADRRTDRTLLAAFAITAFAVGTFSPHPWVAGVAYPTGVVLMLGTWLAARRAR
jgi:ubiquinone biosynthesis protein